MRCQQQGLDSCCRSSRNPSSLSRLLILRTSSCLLVYSNALTTFCEVFADV